MSGQVELATFVRGYHSSYERWMAGPRISGNPDEAFLAIFEALNWAVVVDDRLRTLAGRDWSARYADGDVAAGFRYARNTVHHDWSDALEVTPGFVLPSPLPVGLFEWRWRASLPATRKRGETQYKKHLASKPVRFTLQALDALFAQALSDST